MPKLGAARVYSHGEIEVERVIAYLSDFRVAYDSLLAFDIVTARATRALREGPYPFFVEDGFLRVSGRVVLGRIGRDLRPAAEDIPFLIPQSEQLTLKSVRLESPGFWEFLGSLNPIEVLRKYLNDRHERRKDKAYRETAEERRLGLENLIREEELISARIHNLKELGLTDRDLAPLANQLINRPLIALTKHQDSGVIEYIEVKPEPDSGKDGEPPFS